MVLCENCPSMLIAITRCVKCPIFLSWTLEETRELSCLQNEIILLRSFYSLIQEEKTQPKFCWVAILGSQNNEWWSSLYILFLRGWVRREDSYVSHHKIRMVKMKMSSSINFYCLMYHKLYSNSLLLLPYLGLEPPNLGYPRE